MAKNNITPINPNQPTDANSTLEDSKGSFKDLMVIGWDKDDENIRGMFSSGMCKKSEIIYALELAKERILSGRWS